MDELITKEELAKKCKVHVNTIDSWRKNGMPEIKQGKSVRFDYADVISWLKGKSIKNKSK